MVSDVELSTTMVRWAEVATRKLETILTDPSVIMYTGEGWTLGRAGRIVFGPRGAIFKHWMIENLLYDNDEWRVLESISGDHLRLAMHCDTPVGTPYDGASQQSLKDYCYSLIPEISIDKEERFFLDADDISGRVKALICELNDEHITIKTVWPICGMRSSAPMSVDAEQAFRPLTEREKLSALNFGMIEVFGHQTLIEPNQSDWYGFVMTERFKKCFGPSSNETPSDFMDRYNRREKCLEVFLSVAPVIGEFVAYHAGGHAHAPRFSSSGILNRGETGHLSGHGGSRFLISALSPMLPIDLEERFVKVWKMLVGKGPKNKTASALQNAIRRLYYAETRVSPEDRLVDLMIAAESIYTMDSQAELSFRLSMNAALWHDGINPGRLVAFEEMKDAYNLRSKIVHGSVVDSEKAALLAQKVRGLLKAGIAKAINAHFVGEYPPKWETLVFPKQGDSQ